jgi:hypothetical protein
MKRSSIQQISKPINEFLSMEEVHPLEHLRFKYLRSKELTLLPAHLRRMDSSCAILALTRYTTFMWSIFTIHDVHSMSPSSSWIILPMTCQRISLKLHNTRNSIISLTQLEMILPCILEAINTFPRWVHIFLLVQR